MEITSLGSIRHVTDLGVLQAGATKRLSAFGAIYEIFDFVAFWKGSNLLMLHDDGLERLDQELLCLPCQHLITSSYWPGPVLVCKLLKRGVVVAEKEHPLRGISWSRHVSRNRPESSAAYTVGGGSSCDALQMP